MPDLGPKRGNADGRGEGAVGHGVGRRVSDPGLLGILLDVVHIKAAEDVGKVVVFAGLHGVGGVFVDAELLEAGEEVVELVSAEHLEHKGRCGILAVGAERGELQGVANRQVGVVGDLALFDERLVPFGGLHGSPALGWGVGGCYNIFWRGGGEGSYECCLYRDVCATVDCIFCANQITYPAPRSYFDGAQHERPRPLQQNL